MGAIQKPIDGGAHASITGSAARPVVWQIPEGLTEDVRRAIANGSKITDTEGEPVFVATLVERHE
jgi:hypothetical protein